ncbi:MAG: hypothetical protein H7257_15025, partial [Taibaiella sp.]|nr:hypothetical protein [Taibaiella sp.]
MNKKLFKSLLAAFAIGAPMYSNAQIISTIAGTGTAAFSGDGGQATSAAINTPHGIAVDGAGVVYITDQANQRIRKITTAGVISTIAGSGSLGFSGDGAAATTASFNNPFTTWIDGTGDILFSDSYNNRIRKINTSGIITTIAGTGTAGSTGDGSLATAA